MQPWPAPPAAEGPRQELHPLVPVLLWIGLAVMAPLVAISWWIGETTPAYRLDLSDTTWRVVQVGDAQVPEGLSPTITFFPGSGDVVTLNTPCRTTTVPAGMDTDGAALSFGPVDRADHSCDPEARRWDDMVAAALASTLEWAVDNDAAIRLLGPPVMHLVRVTSP